MSGGIPIRFRRTTSDTPLDALPIGGAMWHMLDNKLGINTPDGMCWYPGVDTKNKLYVLNQDQRLTGKTDAGFTNNLAIDFSTADQIRIVNTSNDNVLASFSAAGAAFANPIVNEVVGGGSFNKGSHPGFIPNLFTSKTASVSTGFVGPNTYLWKKASSVGDVVVGTDYMAGGGDVTHWSAEKYCLSFDVQSALTNVGLRSWFFEPSLAYDGFTNHNTVFVSMYGPANQGNTIRIGRAGSYQNITVIGQNRWVRLAIEIPVHSIDNSYLYGSEPYAIDWFYNTTGGKWYISEPTVQEVSTRITELYQYKTIGERMALADAYYWQSPTIMMAGNAKKSVVLPTNLPVLNSNATYDVTATGNIQTLTVTEKTSRGFVINTLDATPASEWSVKLSVGYRGPLNDIA